MVEVIVRKTTLNHLDEIEDIIIMEELPDIEGEYEVVKVRAKKTPIKKALINLLKKVEFNPRYPEEKYGLKELKRDTYSRSYIYL
ncbi:MAG: hypothetical protein ACXABO_13360 [Promethearchaeota archaeon]|jgi:hypothetical protein